MSSPPGGEHFSLARVLSPLPSNALPVIYDVLSMVPKDLAAPFVAKRLESVMDIEFTELQVRNVLYKLQTYLPLAMPSPAHPSSLPPSMKGLQSLVPGQPITLVSCERETCTFCKGVLRPREARDRCDLHMPAGLRGAPEQVDNRFHIFRSPQVSSRQCSRSRIATLADCTSCEDGRTRRIHRPSRG